jgi:hypothetical protein
MKHCGGAQLLDESGAANTYYYVLVALQQLILNMMMDLKSDNHESMAQIPLNHANGSCLANTVKLALSER